MNFKIVTLGTQELQALRRSFGDGVPESFSGNAQVFA